MKKHLQRVCSLLFAALLLLSCGPINALASIETPGVGAVIRDTQPENHTISGEIHLRQGTGSGEELIPPSQNVTIRRRTDTLPVMPTAAPVPSSRDVTPEIDVAPTENFPSDSMEAAENDVEFSLDDVTAQAGKKVSLNLSLTKNEWAISSATVRVSFRSDFLTFDSASVEEDKDGYDTDWYIFKQGVESAEDASAVGYVASDTNNEDNRQSITFHYQIDSESALGFSGLGTFGSLTFQVAESVPVGMTIPLELEVIDAAWSALDAFEEQLTYGTLYEGSIWINNTSIVTPTPTGISGVHRITFDGNGGTVEGGTVRYTNEYGQLDEWPTATRESDYRFRGWSLSAEDQEALPIQCHLVKV